MWSSWNGSLVSSYEPVIPSMDRGFLLGDGVFDTLLLAQKQPLWGEAHHARLSRHAGRIGLAFPWDYETWLEHIQALVDAHPKHQKHWALRTTLTRGLGPRGLPFPSEVVPHVLMTIAPLVPQLASPGRLMMSEIRRNESSPTSQIKSLGLLDAVLAREEAKKQGFDDALFFNHQGHLTCCTSSNLFLLCVEGLKTPPLSDGVMDGVTRAWVLSCAKEAGIPCAEVSLDAHSLASAVAAFSTNSIQGIRPFWCVESHKKYSFSVKEPFLEKLQYLWEKSIFI